MIIQNFTNYLKKKREKRMNEVSELQRWEINKCNGQRRTSELLGKVYNGCSNRRLLKGNNAAPGE